MIYLYWYIVYEYIKWLILICPPQKKYFCFFNEMCQGDFSKEGSVGGSWERVEKYWNMSLGDVREEAERVCEQCK